jgi:hypothetical protein
MRGLASSSRFFFVANSSLHLSSGFWFSPAALDRAPSSSSTAPIYSSLLPRLMTQRHSSKKTHGKSKPKFGGSQVAGGDSVAADAAVRGQTQSPLAPGAQTGNPIQQQSGLSEALRDIRLDQGPVTSSSSHGGAASIAAAKKGKSPGDHHGHRHHGRDDLAGPTSHELWVSKQPAAAITVEDTSVVPGGATATALTTSAGASSQAQVVAPPTNRADHVHYPSLKKLKETVAHAQLRATFYPKFENEKSDQEVRNLQLSLMVLITYLSSEMLLF